MSRTYSAIFRVVTPKATRVIERFHVMRHAGASLDEAAAASTSGTLVTGAGPAILSIRAL